MEVNYNLCPTFNSHFLGRRTDCGMAMGVAPDLQQMDSLKQLFEDKLSEENRLPLFIKTICIAFIYQLFSAKCNRVMAQKAYDI